MKTVAVSGGFDPVHIGHLRMFKEARKLGDRLVVILNNDNWLTAKKGGHFMPENDRKEIIEAFECVDEVMISFHESHPKDMSICSEIEVLRPNVFANGGDRWSDNIPEYETCKELKIKTVFSVGGDKIRSSSEMINKGNSNKK